MRQAGPPRLAARLLAATIRDADWRDSILGDLREEFEEVARRHGTPAARRWYWRHALALCGRRIAWRRRQTGASLLLAVADETLDRRHVLAGLTRDVQHAWRAVRHRRATSVVIMLTLSVALATNSVTYGVMDAVALRPFRFAGVDRLVMIASHDPQDPFIARWSVTPGDFRDWQRAVTALIDLSASHWWDANLSAVQTPEQIAAYRVTANYFTTFGVRPILGRTFDADDEGLGDHRRVVLGYALWTRLFAADAAIIGRTVRLDGEPYEVIGVAPQEFDIPMGAQLWVPLAYTPDEWADRRVGRLMVLGRLVDGATVSSARAEISSVVERQGREFPETNAARPSMVVSFTAGMRDPGTPAFTAIMLAASILLLLLACANVANLLLASGAERAQEFAMRLALGASRARLTWQLMLEAATVTAGAVLLALPLAWAGLVLARAAIPASVVRFVPGIRYIDVSLAMFWSTAAFGVLAVLGCALLPAFQTTGAKVADVIRLGRSVTTTRDRLWTRQALAATQVAITLALLFGAAILASGFYNALNGPLGFDKQNVLVARVVLPEAPYADSGKRREFIGRVLGRLGAVPAVSSASAVTYVPYGGAFWIRPFFPQGWVGPPAEAPRISYQRMVSGYLETMRIPLLAGRTLTDADRAGSRPVALVSRGAVERFWPQQDPIGRTLRMTADGPDITIVGVVGDVWQDWLFRQSDATIYRPFDQDVPFEMGIVARTVGDPVQIGGEMRRAVAAADPDLPLSSLQSLESLIEERSAGLRFIAGAVSVVAAIALALALLGLYGLIAFVVTRRTQEIGVRMALGAMRWQVTALVTAQGLRTVGCGLVVGVLVAVGVGGAIESSVFGIKAAATWQLPVLAAVVALLCALACYLPARRASQLDPTTALRAE